MSGIFYEEREGGEREKNKRVKVISNNLFSLPI
jgi:hypothetical protein